MAQNIGEAQINLSVNTSQMEREVSAALKRLESRGFNLGQGINSRAFTQPLGRITGAANEFQKSLDASNARVIAFGASAGAIYNVQRAFITLIGSTIEVQKSLADINVILGVSAKSLDQFGNRLFEIAKNSGQAFSTVATAAGELARQGLSLEQTLKRTSDALILARLSGLDAASSVEALTASINSFNNSALDSTQIVNKLASVDAAFAVSSADLAEALKRVGSSAQDVGVSFDQLLAIVASVNQTTARGGAVIGNSLKTIFTRVQRTDVLDQLEGLGIAVRDLQGNTAPAIQILTGLATKFDQLGAAQKAQIAELVGGVFQINVLKAALGDLSREYSVYGNALKISSGATDEAIKRNEELNKTLSALINKTIANLTKAGSDIGSLTLAPAIERVLGTLNGVLESFDFKGGSGLGNKIGKGILEGIGDFIVGPGLLLLGAVFTKIFINLTKFTADATKTFLGLGKAGQEQAKIQERINSILTQNPQLVQNIVNKQISLLQVEKDILTVIQAQSAARQQSNAIAASLTKGLVTRGVVSTEKGVITAPATTRNKSQGFIPNFNANKEIMGAISGGYMPGEVRSMNIPNYGRVTYNDAETVKKFSGLSQPGIMPPANSEAGKAYKQKFKGRYGIDPYANRGFIPNFASYDAMVERGYIPISKNIYDELNKKNSPFKQYLIGGTSEGGSFLKNSVKDNALSYYKTQTEARALGLGKGVLSKDEINQTGAVLVYPSFGGTGLGSTKATADKYMGKRGDPNPEFIFSTFGFPGGKGGLGAELYTDIEKKLKGAVYTFINNAALNPENLVRSGQFKNYVDSNFNRSTIEAAIGSVFEAGLKSAIFSAVEDPNAPLDLTKDELNRIAKTFKGAEVLNKFKFGEVKNALNPDQAQSMANKIASNQGYPLKSQAKTKKALGFIPNFSPLDKAFSTEKSLGGKPTLDYKEGLGLYVRDGKTQPNFAAVMRDHPEGISNAIQNSKKIQGMMTNGFIPNFAGVGLGGFDPTSLMLLLLGQRRTEEQAATLQQTRIEQIKYKDLLRERNKALNNLKNIERSSANDEQAISNARKQLESATVNLANYRQQASREGPILGVGSTALERRVDFNRRGGVGGAIGRFGSRYGAAATIAAPIIGGIISQYVGDDVSRGGRATRAGVTGAFGTLGAVGTAAALGGGPMTIGAAGVAAGGLAVYNVISELKDIMPEVAKEIEIAKENFNNLTVGAQTLNTSLETLNTLEERPDLSTETKVRLIQKANSDIVDGLNQIAMVSPKTAEEVKNLYVQLGNTAELRERINLALAESRGTLNIAESKGAFLKGGMDRAELMDRFGFLTGDKTFRELDKEQKIRFQNLVDQQAKSLETYYEAITEKQLTQEDARKIQNAAENAKQGIASISDGINTLGLPKDQAEALTALIEEGKRDLTPVIEAFIAMENRRIEYENLQNKINQIAATRNITTMEGLSGLLGRTGNVPISPRDLERVRFTDVNQSLQAGVSKGFEQDFTKQYTDLYYQVGNTSTGMKQLEEFTKSYAEIVNKVKDKTMSVNDAFAELKLRSDAITFQTNASKMFSSERAEARQNYFNDLLKQGKLQEGFQPVTSFFDRFGDNAQTTARKINESFANLAENMQTGFEDAFGAFLDGTKTAEDAFRDMALSISQQIIKEQFSIGMRSLLGGLTGGGGFGGTANNSGGLLGGIFNSIFGGGKAKGGLIKKYSGGGYVDGGSGVKDDVPAMLTDGEYVLRKSAVNKYGINALNMLNQGGMIKGYSTGAKVTAESLPLSMNKQLNQQLYGITRLQGGIKANIPGTLAGGFRLKTLYDISDRTISGFIQSAANQYGQPWNQFNSGNTVARGFMLADPSVSVKGEPLGGMMASPRVKIGSQYGSTITSSAGGRAAEANPSRVLPMFKGVQQGSIRQAALYGVNPAQTPIYGNFGIEDKTPALFKGKNLTMSQFKYLEGKYSILDDEKGLSYPKTAGGMGAKPPKNLPDWVRLKPLQQARARAYQGLHDTSSPFDPSKVRAALGENIQFGVKSSEMASPEVLLPKIAKPYARLVGDSTKAIPVSQHPLLKSLMRYQDKITRFGSPLLKTGVKMLGVAGGIFGNLDLFDQWMAEQGYYPFPGGGDNILSKGGRIRGYATGGSINSLLVNQYDFYGVQGERLTRPFTDEAFKTTVNAPEELANVPALTGRFNISDLLSTRAITDENNPMNALRSERFMGMQNYQQQVSNFKTSYNEQMRQVEEMRRKAQEEANRINSERMAAYNRQVTQGFIGGLLGVGMGLFGSMASVGKFGSGLGSLFGGGGGGGSIGNTFLGFFQDIGKTVMGSIGQYSGMQTSIPGLTDEQTKEIKRQVEMGQLSGFRDPFAKQMQLLPQYGPGAGGIGFGPGGFQMMGGAPSSTYQGLAFNVGLGAPAGYKTYTQNAAQDYFMMFARPVDPLFYARGNVAPILTNPYEQIFGQAAAGRYAIGGKVKGYRTGADVKKQAFVDQNYPIAFLIAQKLGTTPEAVLAQFALESDYGMSELARFGFNLAGIKAGGGYKGDTITLPANADERARGELSPNVYRKYKDLNEFTEDFIQFMKKPRYKEALGVTDVAKRADILARQGYAGKLPEGAYATKVAGTAKALRSYLPQARSTLPISIDPEGIATTGGGPKGTFPAMPQVSIAGLPPELQRQVDLGFLTPEAAKKAMQSPQGVVNMPFPSRSTMPMPAFPISTPQIAGTNPPVVTAGTSLPARTQISRLYENPRRYARGAPQALSIPEIPVDLPQPWETVGKPWEVVTDAIKRLYPNGFPGYPGKPGIPPSNRAMMQPPKAYKPGGLPSSQKVTKQDFNPFADPEFAEEYQKNLADLIKQEELAPQDLYRAVGALMDTKNVTNLEKGLQARFSSFYTNQPYNRLLLGTDPMAFMGKSSYGQLGFNNYLNYLGFTGSTTGQLGSFKFPRTPNALSPFAFGSRYFGGFGNFGGANYGFSSSTGIPFSNWFSTGSRLGITPSWASRATGGMIYGGTSTKDDVPAMLMGGEYVIRKDVVDRMGELFFNRLNRGQVQGFAEGGPVGTSLPSIGLGGEQNNQDNSRAQFVDAMTKLLKSLDQLNRTVEDQTKEMKDKTETEATVTDTTQAGGVTNNITISVNVDQNGQTSQDKKDESQDSEGNDMNDQEKFKKTMERSRILAELLRQQILKVIVEEQRPGGVLYQGSKGRDLGR
jgi:TP901 family phage tail tape measure protein